MIGYIYKIEIENELYIGSTDSPINLRQNTHNYRLRNEPHRGKMYSYALCCGIKTIECVEICKVEVENITELKQIEESYRKNMNATLNCIRCYRTDEEKKQQIHDSKNKYYKKNQQNRLVKIECSICKKLISKCNISKHKKSKSCLSKIKSNYIDII